MRIGILGPLQVMVGDRAVEVGGARLRALLTRLAMDAGRPVSTEVLAEVLWPERRPADWTHALQALVSRLRGVLPDGAVLRSVPGGYVFDLPAEAVDALRFQRLVIDGQRAIKERRPEAGARLLRQALELWRGEALADIRHTPFASAVVARLDELRLTAVEERVQAELITDVEHEGSLPAELEQLAAAHPFRERLRCLHMRALRAQGRHAEALRIFADYRRLLADTLGAEPGPEAQAVHLALLRTEQARRLRRGNLRAPLTSFIKRPQEQARVVGQLGEGRLVTLVGPGGGGKTRLATTVAADLADEGLFDVWLVDLGTVTSPDDVPQAVAGAIELHREGGPAAARDVTRQLVTAFVAGSPTLLVLDNCEHLTDAVAHLVDDLLGGCADLRVLATSREPLGITGEALCAVPPLPLPEQDATAAEAARVPSVRLFVDRVSAVRPGFTVTEANVAAVREICRRLDGLPLAIELAAARMRLMSLDNLAARLDARFQVLNGGGRTALPRHRTLRAVVAWSWELLDAEERATVERLAVFPGSFDSAAASCVGAPAEVLEALVDKSLIQMMEHGTETRYRMLETIREYGMECLAAAGKMFDARSAHADCFLALAERAAPHLRGADQLPWIARLTAERDNLTAALHFACNTGEGDIAARLGAALWYFWAIRSEHAEAVKRLRGVLSTPADTLGDARVVATAGYFFLTVLSGTSESERDFCRELPPVDDAHPYAALIANTRRLILDGPDASPRPSHAGAWMSAMLLWTGSYLHANRGDRAAQCRDLALAAAHFRRVGERWGLAMSLANLAMSTIMMGDHEDGVAALEESVRLVGELGADDYQRLWLAIVRFQAGDLDGARVELLEIVGGEGRGRYAATARLFLGEVARCAGDLDEATRQIELAVKDRGVVDDGAFDLLVFFGLGHLAVTKGDIAMAERNLGEALDLVAARPDLPTMVHVGAGVADLAWRHGHPLDAATALGAAHAFSGMPDAHNVDVRRLTRRLREVLGDSSFDAAYRDGRTLDRAGALALIRAQLSRRAGRRTPPAGRKAPR